jgi:hypothetical protein
MAGSAQVASLMMKAINTLGIFDEEITGLLHGRSMFMIDAYMF